jgi:hypothetical protein
MPNWVQNNLVISGENKYLNALREQMNKSYDTHHYDWETNSFKHLTTEGQFLLWNIVRPTNLDAYYQVEEMTEKAQKRAEADSQPALQPGEILNKLMEGVNNLTAESMQTAMTSFHEEVAVGQDWYTWNIREWGTKWEISEAHAEQTTNQLIYQFSSAWSPPEQALRKLAAQYPKLVFTLRCLDEGDCFASEIHWRNGKLEFETELDINHALKEEMYGVCWACGDGNENDPEYEEYRQDLNCAEFNKPVEIDEVI